MDRPRFQVNIGTIMAAVAIVAVMIVTWPYSAPIVDVAIAWSVFRAAGAPMRSRWRQEGREPTRRERAAADRGSCLFTLAFWAALLLIVNGLKLIWR